MAATLMQGKPVAEAIRARLSAKIERIRNAIGRAPCIATVMVGSDEAVSIFARRIARVHEGLGITHLPVELPPDTTPQALTDACAKLSGDPNVDGIIPLLPLPEHLSLEDALRGLSPEKDVDGIHPINAGRLLLGQTAFVPATPAGGMEILAHYGIELRGKRAVVVGRSNIVGKPMALLLLAQHATVTICHSRTHDLPSVVREADVVAAAVGRPAMIKGDWLKSGAVVVDFGINSVDGQVVGDVEFASAQEVASAITPVPGGTGPVTNLMLASNTVEAASRLASL